MTVSRKRLDEAYAAYQELAVLLPLKQQSPFVGGDGPLTSPLLLVGEAPGADEVRTGRPFTGRAGQLLDRMLRDAGLDRRLCFVTNVVKFRPPGNRTPQLFEIYASRPCLHEEISVIRPYMIIAWGSVALRALRPDGPPVSGCHGTIEPWRHPGGFQAQLLPLYHPSAALRDSRIEKATRDDLSRAFELREAAVSD